MGLDEIVALIMAHKEILGEFSLDLYYNDLAKEGEQFVARFDWHGKKPVRYFRGESFYQVAIEGLRYVSFGAGMIYRGKKVNQK